MYLWAIKKTISIGKTTIVDPARIVPIFSPYCPAITDIATGNVYILSSVATIRGQRKEFQAPIKAKTKEVIRKGVERGKIILK
jgi:hypothetical protein